jgi:hypothetical protein
MRFTLLAGTAFLAFSFALGTAALAQTAATPATSTQSPATASGPSSTGATQNTSTSPAPTSSDSTTYFPPTLPIVADTSGTASTQPEDGQVIVRLNGRFRFYGGLFDDQDLNRSTVSNTVTLSPVTLTYVSKGKTLTGVFLTEKTSSTASYGQNKQADYGFIEYVRLYPGFDGRTAGGLKYGVSIEIRQDNTVAPGGGTAGSVSGADTQMGLSRHGRTRHDPLRHDRRCQFAVPDRRAGKLQRWRLEWRHALRPGLDRAIALAVRR